MSDDENAKENVLATPCVCVFLYACVHVCACACGLECSFISEGYISLHIWSVHVEAVCLCISVSCVYLVA